jgi:hypothetical protein
MNANQPLQLKRLFLYLLIASVCLSAFLGIGALLTGSFGWVQVRILLTTVVLTGASICGLGCGALWERGRLRPLAAGGIGLATLSAFLLIMGMWTEINSEGYWKTAMSLTVLAIAAAHLSLLSLARLAPRFKWAWVGAYASIIGLALLIDAMIFGEPRSEEIMFRVLGVLAIISASFSILIPILHRLSRTPGRASLPADAVLSAGGEEPLDAELQRLRARIQELEAGQRHGVPANV